MTDTQTTIIKIGEIERRISDGEALLRGLERASGIGWFLVVSGLLLIVFLGKTFFIILGFLLLIIGIVRLFSVANHRKELELGLREYRGRKAELQASLLTKE